MRRRSYVAIASCLLAVSLRSEARPVIEPEDPAFANALTHDFDGIEDATPTSAAFVLGSTLVTIESNGIGGEVLSCFEPPACDMVAYQESPVTITFDPPVAAAALDMDYSVGPFTITATGESETEVMTSDSIGWEHPSGIFVGAADIGPIESLYVEAMDYGTFFEALHIAEDSIAGDGPDVSLALRSESRAAGANANYDVDLRATNNGPGVVTDPEVTVFIPGGAEVRDSQPSSSPMQTRATVGLGALDDGASADADFQMRTPNASRFWCEDTLRTIAVVRHGQGDANPRDNIVVAATPFDRSTVASREDCTTPLDDDCDGLHNCFDDDCASFDACQIDLSSIARAPFPPPFPIIPLPGPDADDDDPFRNFPRPGDIPARSQQCQGSNIHGDLVDRPAICCAGRPQPGTPTYSEWLRKCPPLDPNYKEADPPVNGIGYGTTEAGQRIQYAVTYENIGGGDAHDVAIIDTLHRDLDVSTLEVEDGGTYDETTRTLYWHDPVLPPHEPRTVHFSIQVRGDAPLGTRVRNVATIVFPDAVPPTAIDTPLVEHVIPEPGLTAAPDLFVAECLEAGANRFTVRLENHGFDFAYNARVEIADAPEDFEVLDDTCAFAHPTDDDPEVLSVVLPWSYSDSIDTVEFTAPADLDDPCAEITWRIIYLDKNGNESRTEGKGDGRDDADPDPKPDDGGESDSDSSGADEDDGGDGCGCRGGTPRPTFALLLFALLWVRARGRR